MSEKIIELRNVVEEVRRLYNLVYGFLLSTNDLIKSKSLSNKDLCDFGFFSKELENIFDELRKEVKARKEICGSIISYNIIKESINDPTIGNIIKGEFSSASADMKMEVALPEKNSEEYKKILEWFIKYILHKFDFMISKLDSNNKPFNIWESYLNVLIEPILKDIIEEFIKEGIFKLDWNKVTELCTKFSQEGKSIPEGFGKQYPKYFVTYRKKNIERKNENE